MFFKKKTKADIVAEDRELIAINAETVGRLITLADGREELAAKLKELSEKLKYLKPVNTEKAAKTDKRIRDRIDDLKIELSRSGDASERIPDGLLSDILLLLVNRTEA